MRYSLHFSATLPGIYNHCTSTDRKLFESYKILYAPSYQLKSSETDEYITRHCTCRNGLAKSNASSNEILHCTEILPYFMSTHILHCSTAYPTFRRKIKVYPLGGQNISSLLILSEPAHYQTNFFGAYLRLELIKKSESIFQSSVILLAVLTCFD